MGTGDGTEQTSAVEEPTSVFVSYSRVDQKAALPIVHALEQAGFSVWWDGMLEGGERYLNTTEAALENAKAVVVLWSGKSVASHWVHDEAMRGRDRNCLVPLSIDGSEPPLGFRQFQTIDFSKHGRKARGDALDAMVRAVGALVKGTRSGPAVDSWRSAQTRVASLRRAVPLWAWLVAALALIGAAGWWLLRPGDARGMSLGLSGIEAIGPGVEPGLTAGIAQELRAALGEKRVALTAGSADLLLKGTVRRVGNSARLVIHVDDAASATTLWTRSEDLPAGNAQVLAEFARTVADIVECGLTGTRPYRRRLEPAQFSIYLRYCQAETAHDSMGERLDAARAVTAQAPDFPTGWLSVAETIGLYLYHNPSERTQALEDEGIAAARRLIALVPEAADGHAMLAWMLPPERATEREALLRHAIERPPYSRGGTAFQLLGDFLLQSGRAEEALGMYRRGVDQEPAGPIALWRLAMAYDLTGRADRADEAIRQARALRGDTPWLRGLLHLRAVWKGRWTEAAELVQLESAEEQAAIRAAYLALHSRDPARIAAAGSAVERIAPRHETELVVIPALAQLGRLDAAFAGLEGSLRAKGHYAAPGRYPGMARPNLWNPALRPLWSDPRFPAFLQRAGFIAYWRESRTRPDVCRVAGAPPFCAEIR